MTRLGPLPLLLPLPRDQVHVWSIFSKSRTALLRLTHGIFCSTGCEDGFVDINLGAYRLSCCDACPTQPPMHIIWLLRWSDRSRTREANTGKHSEKHQQPSGIPSTDKADGQQSQPGLSCVSLLRISIASRSGKVRHTLARQGARGTSYRKHWLRAGLRCSCPWATATHR